MIRGFLAAVIAVLPLAGGAQIPDGYYSSVDTSSAATLRATLHEVIDDHNRISFGDSPTTFAILENADENPQDPGEILDIYMNEDYPEVDSGVGEYDREHIWPRSLGFPDNSGIGAFPHSDLHALFLSDKGYNSSRGNEFYDFCSAACDERPTMLTNGEGGGSGVYPGNSNWTDSDSWEVWIGRRGDAARALFYMDVRYEGDAGEPDLILTSNTAQILASNTGSNEAIAYMGRLDVLVDWNAQDPVDPKETARMEVVADAQNNRNPFVDYPQWVDCLFAADCSGVAPIRPDGLILTLNGNDVELSWNPRPETDLAGYTVYRTAGIAGTPVPVSGLLNDPTFTDPNLTPGTTYFYSVTASDIDGNESDFSAVRDVTIGGGTETELVSFSFETEAGYTITPEPATDGSGDYFGVFAADTVPAGFSAPLLGIDGARFIAGEDTNGFGSSVLPADGIFTVELDPVNITGESGLRVRLAVSGRDDDRYDSADLANGDYLRIIATIDGGTPETLGQFTRVGSPAGSNGPLGVDRDLDGIAEEPITDFTQLLDYTFEVPGTGDELVVSLVARFESGEEEIVFDHVRIIATEAAGGSGDVWELY